MVVSSREDERVTLTMYGREVERGGGGEEEKEEEEKKEERESPKSKNPTQRCGELLWSLYYRRRCCPPFLL